MVRTAPGRTHPADRVQFPSTNPDLAGSSHYHRNHRRRSIPCVLRQTARPNLQGYLTRPQNTNKEAGWKQKKQVTESSNV